MRRSKQQCLGSGTSVGHAGGGMRRAAKRHYPVCGKLVGIRPGKAGRLYVHKAAEGGQTRG